MRFLLPLALACLSCVGHRPAAAAPIRLVSTRVVGGDSAEAQMIVHVAAGRRCRSLWIREPVNQAGCPFVRNRAGTLAALNISGATKTGYVYLLSSGHGAGLTVVRDFDARVVSLCAHRGRRFGDDKVFVDRITGNVVSVWSVLYGEGHSVTDLHVRIKVDSPAKFRLLGITQETEGPRSVAVEHALQPTPHAAPLRRPCGRLSYISAGCGRG